MKTINFQDIICIAINNNRLVIFPYKDLPELCFYIDNVNGYAQVTHGTLVKEAREELRDNMQYSLMVLPTGILESIKNALKAEGVIVDMNLPEIVKISVPVTGTKWYTGVPEALAKIKAGDLSGIEIDFNDKPVDMDQYQSYTDKPTTKQELAEQKYPGETFDYALPQPIINRMHSIGFDDAASQFVYLYPKDGRTPHLAPLTDKGIYILSVMACNF